MHKEPFVDVGDWIFFVIIDVNTTELQFDIGAMSGASHVAEFDSEFVAMRVEWRKAADLFGCAGIII